MKFSLLGLSMATLLVAAMACSSDDGGSDTPVDPTPDDTNPVKVWLTTRNGLNTLKKQNSVAFSSDIGDFTLRIDTTVSYQSMDGFGAALTGSSAYLIQNMDEASRSILLNDLFDPDKGIGLNYLRVTIGSSDFSLGNYTYCDEADISTFSIPAIDKRDLLPVLKQIIQINPSIKLLASPWSAPAWMKGNKNLYGGSLSGSAVYDDFATYFIEYIKAFAAEGIHIDAVTLQNEPRHQIGSYPTMYMEWDEQNTIIRDYLGPKMVTEGLTTKIIIWDHNYDGYDYPIHILDDQETRVYVAGTGFHGYGGNAGQITNVTAAHPDKDIYFTELSGGGWNTEDPIGNMLYYMRDHLMATVNYGSKNFLMWNLALDANNGPVTTSSGGCQDCRGVVTIKSTSSYSVNEEYYLLGHFSKLVRLGAKRVANTLSGSVPSGVHVCTFMNADGSKVAVVMNRSGSNQRFTVRCGSRKFTYSMATEAVASFYFK
ncbi:MAG: glycoside hydrolase family 30 beta sandwich domain-containing protein [Breznakibacter sp.]